VAGLAARQWGVLTRDEFLVCGLSKSAIQVRVATERLFPLTRPDRMISRVRAFPLHAS
jgi:hypothetical protein